MHAVVLFCVLLVFVQLKVEISTLRRQDANRNEECKDLAGRIGEHQAHLELLKNGLAKLEQRVETVTTQSVRQQALDSNRRAHVFRLHQRGERPDQISRTLNLPRAEVDLLLKIQKYSAAT
jgi:uncharacterized protein YlxW (UPF0749 family)